MPKLQTRMKTLLDNTYIPALSLSWCQKGKKYSVASGVTDTAAPSLVNTNTLFQAASLSKPVSAAIILDLVTQGQWDLDIPLADITDYGPPELRQDPHYRTLTTRMVIGQCSGLANFGQDGDDGTKFIAAPTSRFTYSGVALDFLKQVVENQTHKEWEEIAQDFFNKADMKASTFRRQLPDSFLHGRHRDIASAHRVDPSPAEPITPLPPAPDDTPGIPAGSLLTTAEDYISFLQYCFKNDYLKSTLLRGVLTKLPPTASPETSQIQWGLGMGVYSDQEKTIAFHWGNNTGSISFCAMDIETGDCVVSFANSMNGPSVFQLLAEPIVGDIEPLFQWLSQYCCFKDVRLPKEPETLATSVHSIQTLARKEFTDKNNETAYRFKHCVEQIKASYMTPTISSQAKERERFDPPALGVTSRPPWKP